MDKNEMYQRAVINGESFFLSVVWPMIRFTVIVLVGVFVLLFFSLRVEAQPVDFSDMCDSGTTLEDGGCLFWNFGTIYTYTGSPITLQWVPSTDDEFRIDRLFYFAEIRTWPQDTLAVALQTEIQQQELFWTANVGGHYLARVRACDINMVPDNDPVNTIPDEHCSDWAVSLNDVNTPDTIPGWVIYAEVAPATGGGIE